MKQIEIYKLIDECNNLLCRSYSPYSNFAVAAIVIDENGNKYGGVNIENASYGLSICAERCAIFNGVFNNLKKIKSIVITARNLKIPVSPCGACRQVIREFSDFNTKIILGNANNYNYFIYNIDELLPYGFDNNSL